MRRNPLVLVTGASGFVGSHLVERFIREGVRVRCLVRRSSDLRWLNDLDVERHSGDVTDPASLPGALAGVSHVAHAAGLVCAGSLEDYLLVNRDGTKNLIRACQRHAPDLERFVFISSQAAVGPAPPDSPATEENELRPVSHYGRSKAEAENIVREASGSLRMTILRPPAVFGPRDVDVYYGFLLGKYGLSVRLASADQRVNFAHVYDLVEGTLRATMHPDAVGETFFLGSEENYATVRICRAIASAIRAPLLTLAIPRWALNLAGLVAEIAAKPFGRTARINRQKVLELTAPHWCLSVDKARRVLGYRQAVTLEQGIGETARWYQDHGWI